MIRDLSLSAIPKHVNFAGFNIQTHCVIDMFLRYLQQLEIKKFEKIAIKLFDFQPERFTIEADNVLLVNVQDDLNQFISLNSNDRKHWMLKKVVDTLHHLSETYKFDTNIVNSAYKQCLAQNLRNEYTHGEIQYSNDKSRFGLVFCKHSTDKFEILAQIFNEKGTKVGTKKLIETRPIWDSYLPYLGKVSTSNGEIVLNSADGKTKLTCEFTFEGNDGD